MSPKELVEEWVKAFNEADSHKLSHLYHEDAINHQVNTDPVEGRENIRKMFLNEFANAEMECQIVNLFEDGEWAILEWKDPIGLRGCGFFQIRNDLIVFQRGYWDRLSFLKLQGLPIPTD